MRRFLVSFVVTLVFVSLAFAHPVPKTNRDRTLVVHVTATALVVDYRLELDEGSIPNELTSTERAHVSTRNELLRTFTQSFAEATCRTLDASLDGRELRFRCIQQKYTAGDHVRCDYCFESAWNLTPGTEYKLKFHDTNYNTDDFSRLYIYLTADESVRLLSEKAPSTELMSRSSDDRKPGDDNRLRRAEAQFRLAETEPRAVSKPTFPPDEVFAKSEPDGRVSEGKPSETPCDTVSKGPPEKTDSEAGGESSIVEPSSFWGRIIHPNVLLNLLLDSREGLVLLLLIAGLAGAAHALTPGHGKTLVAAYLVGQRGTYWHAVLLGVVTTLTHTGAVIVLAVPLQLLRIDQKQMLVLFELIGGFLIAGFGLWLLFRRLSGQADHFHIGGGHHHHLDLDADTHDEPAPVVLAKPKKSRIWEVVALGLLGGMVPCGDAVILLSFAISSGHIELGLPLLLAFSAGLASVLVVLGLMVVGATRVAQMAAPSSDRLSALVRPLPILSAVIVFLMGLWLCYGALNP